MELTNQKNGRQPILLWVCLAAWIVLQGWHIYASNISATNQSEIESAELQALRSATKAAIKSDYSTLQLSSIEAVVYDEKGVPTYWNTPYQLIPDKNSAVATNTMELDGHQIDYRPVQKREIDTLDRWVRWLALGLLLVVLLFFLRWLSRLNKPWHIISQVATIAGLVGSCPYLYLPTAVVTPIAGVGSFSLLAWLGLIVVLWLLCSQVHNLVRTIPPHLSLARSLMAGVAIGSTFALFITFIKCSATGSIFSRGLDIPLHYYPSGITLLLGYVVFGLFAYLMLRDCYQKWAHTLSTKVKYSGLVLGIAISILTINARWPLELPLAALFAFLVAYVLISDIYHDQKHRSAAFLFLWLIIFAGFIASGVFHFQLIEDIRKRTAFAESIYIPESSAQTQVITDIDQSLKASSVFAQLSTLPYPAKLDVQDFTSFLEDQVPALRDYSYELECYDTDGSTIFRNYYTSQTDLELALSKGKRLSEHIYYNALTSEYILKYAVENTTFPQSGLELSVRIDIEMAVPFTSENRYQYLIQDGDNILATNSRRPELQDLSNRTTDSRSGKKGDIRYTVVKPEKDVTVTVVRDLDGLLKPISLFSFITTLAGLILLFLILTNKWLRLLPTELDLAMDYRNSLRNKIQLTIVSLTIFSFILIGLMTIIYFKNVLEERSAQQQESEISSIVKNVFSTLSGSVDFQGKRTILSGELDKISHVHEKDLSLYDMNGILLRSTARTKVPPRVPYAVKLAANDATTTRLLPRLSSTTDMHYLPLTANGNAFAILALPEAPQTISSNSILDFLSTILNVYIFLFLVAAAIAIAISNSITRPLSFLKEKLSLFKLGKNQEPLQWNSKDEIGSLINSYNQLIAKLDESANVIAKTERDTAWREMAKQVAHEIKNPLTPMKLSIQHLQRLSQREITDVQPMVGRISKTLLEQFNNLDNIANSFSNFATMPTASNEKLVINEVVESIHDLFRKREDMDISLSEPINDMYVFADRNHLVRVLNNIVKNAIQAIPEDRPGTISISLSQVANKAVIKVTDNGTGIPDHMKEKVFTPNFTTKSSGTGLGLAISANMIESFNGRIYFETEENVGTSFYIEIPLMRLDDNYLDQNRVSLD